MTKNRRSLKAIVGLGNPGKKYQYNRHNIGYRVVRSIAAKNAVRFKKSLFFSSLLAHSALEESALLLVLPTTYMNLSGRAVARILKTKKISAEDVLVVCDDIDLEFGKIRLRLSGSDGGHRGLASIINSLHTREFARLKIGIGRPESKDDVKEYVLTDFKKSEEQDIEEIIEEAETHLFSWLSKRKEG
ncbi:aminoacyl-tRNA hydrolase [Candidatus Omnitrophota bacterium]